MTNNNQCPLRKSSLEENLEKRKRKIEFSYPRGNYPRLCLIGNSNVGKSSITKWFLSNEKFYTGKIGKTPGNTVKLNLIDDPTLKYQIVDLPGFGKMIRLNRKQEVRIQEQILEYLEVDKQNLFLCIVIANAARIEDELDKYYFQRQDTIPLTMEIIMFALRQEIPCVLVLNKADKLNKYDRKRVTEKLDQVIVDFNLVPEGIESEKGLLDAIFTSMKTEEGLKPLKSLINLRVQRIDFSDYDARNELHKLPPVKKPQKSNNLDE